MPTVTSNGIAIPFDRDHFAPLVDSTSLLGAPAGLRERYDRDGYLYLRGILDPLQLRRLRRAYFSLFPPSYLAHGFDPGAGVFSGSRPDRLPAHGTVGHPAWAFVRSPQFLRFCADSRLAELAGAVLDEPVIQLPRRILRHFDRSGPVASRAHLDRTYLDAGSDKLLTAWIPIGACPLATGGLVYLEDSHRLDHQTLEALRARTDRAGDLRPLSHDLGWVAEELGRRWRHTDYEAGDVTLHSPHIVHASLDTTSAVMRLSADLRYVAAGSSPDERWLQPWAGDDGY